MKAYELIERGWTQGMFACDAQRREVSPQDPDAKYFCVSGALQRVYPEIVEFRAKVHEVVRELGGAEVTQWNDDPNRQKQEVVALLKKLDF